MTKYIIINKDDYKYIKYDSSEKDSEALYGYLCAANPPRAFIYDWSTIELDDGAILHYCSGAELIDINGTEIDSSDLEELLDIGFDGYTKALVDYLTANNMLALSTEFNEEFKNFMWDVVYRFSQGKPFEGNLFDIDFDDLFVSIHQGYGIDTAIDCVERLL